MNRSIVIATRKSRLALWQAEHVQALLRTRGHTVQLLPMSTRGDEVLDRTLSKVGGKGLFVKALEVALEERRADIAVHSLKDVPMELPDGFALTCVLARADPRDAWVSPQFERVESLPRGAIIGTSSLRRTALLRALLAQLGRTDVRIEPLRGNLDTRLGKLDAGQYAGIVLAASGLQRLGLDARIRHVFEIDQMLPSAGQGALGVEIRADRADLVELLQPLADSATYLATAAERAVSRAMGGSCSMPLAAHARFEGSTLTVRGAWGQPDGSVDLVTAQASGPAPDATAAEALGLRIAADLRAGGAH